MNSAAAPTRGLVGKLVGLVIKLVVLLVIVTAVAWIATRPVTPDAIYSHALPQDAALGTLLKSEPFAKAAAQSPCGTYSGCSSRQKQTLLLLRG